MLWGCSRFHLGKRGLFVGVLCATSIFFSRRWRIFYESRLLYHVLSPCPFILAPPSLPFSRALFDAARIARTHEYLVPQNWQGVSTTVEHERTSNAFLLFYEKAVPREESITGDGSAEGGHANAPQEEVVGEKEKPVTVSGGSRQGVVGGGEVLTLGGVPLLDGAEAFSDEVYQANAHFMLNTNVFDPDFDIFFR